MATRQPSARSVNAMGHAAVARLMQAFKAPSAAALAELVGRDLHTLRVWRSRGQVPLPVLVEAARATGCSLTWLQSGKAAQETSSTTSKATGALTQREADLIGQFRQLDKKQRKVVCRLAEVLVKRSAAA